MKNSMYLYPYKPGSASAKVLSNNLEIKRIKRKNSKFKGTSNKIVINFGSSSLPSEVLKCKILNNPQAVEIASNKLKTFFYLKDVPDINIPEFTAELSVAQNWTENNLVVIRNILNGNSGKGIEIVDNLFDVTYAPLYTKYIPKKDEYRVHVFRDTIIDLQRKARSSEIEDEDVNWQIRNHANGFIFMREGVELPDSAKEMCIKAIKVVGLDFGAIDLIWNEKENKYYILEINTAMGLEGTTLEKYKDIFNIVRES